MAASSPPGHKFKAVISLPGKRPATRNRKHTRSPAGDNPKFHTPPAVRLLCRQGSKNDLNEARIAFICDAPQAFFICGGGVKKLASKERCQNPVACFGYYLIYDKTFDGGGVERTGGGIA
jgi:hypothetical protein